MTPKINQKIVLDHVGVATPGLLEAIKFELSMYPEWRAMWDGRASVQLKQLRRLRDALKKTDRSARHLVEEYFTDSRGFLKVDIDLEELEKRLDREIHNLDAQIENKRRRSPKKQPKQRQTEEARNAVASDLGSLFKQHYCLNPDSQEYRRNLDAFLRSLLWMNGIAYPEPHDDPKHRDDFLRRLRLI